MSCVMSNEDIKTEDGFAFSSEFKNWSKAKQDLANLQKKRADFYHMIEGEINAAEVIVGKNITEKIKPILDKIEKRISFDRLMLEYLAYSGFDESGLCKYFLVKDGDNDGENVKLNFTFYKSEEDGSVLVTYEERVPENSFGKFGVIKIPIDFSSDNLPLDSEIAEILYDEVRKTARAASNRLIACC